ncbi:MAG: OmpH family outer membrane protein [Gammaproteobacteria bacterium]|nr:OmpH family outer membrane protein [Gammaproteobacteria bacterium]
MKTLQILMTIALLAVASASGAQSTARIGFVSLDRILRDAAPAVRAQKKIEAEFSKRDQELQRNAAQMKQMQAYIAIRGAASGSTARRLRLRMNCVS